MKTLYWILPGLLAGRPGPQIVPWDLAELREMGFQTIVSLVSVDGEPIRAAGFRHLYVPLDGALAFLPVLRRRLARRMRPVVDFIAEEVAAGCPTLVHCRQGNDRTGAVLAAYLACYRGLTPEEAIQRVLEANPQAMRSLGFKRLVRTICSEGI